MATPALNASKPTPIQSTSQIQYDSSGKLVGIDGVLDQIGAAMARQATPLLRDVILPAIREDKGLQRTVGAAAGVAIARELKPFLYVIAGAALAVAWYSYRSYRATYRPSIAARANPLRLPSPKKKRRRVK